MGLSVGGSIILHISSDSLVHRIIVLTMQKTNLLEHPVAAIGAVVLRNNRMLLVKRGRPPSEGLWAVPGGKINLGETLQQAAEREVKEETGIVIKAGAPIYAFDLIERVNENYSFHYVIVDLLCQYLSGELNPRDDASDAVWVDLNNFDIVDIDPNTKRFLNQFKQYQSTLETLAGLDH